MFVPSNRQKLEDQQVKADVNGVDCRNRILIRAVAKEVRFSKVDFKYTIFDTCYFRKCVFDSCDFTGCRFTATNLHGSSFTGCKFDYAIFERTIVDSDLLENSCPGLENLKMKFARTLRMNYQQIGDAAAANKAIKIELQATELHLRKACFSNESYYRDKYFGYAKFKVILEYCVFRILDFVWGNGENTYKLLRSVALCLFLISITDALSCCPGITFLTALCRSPQIFFGTLVPQNFSTAALTLILCVRLISFAFFMSIVIKRFNRR